MSARPWGSCRLRSALSAGPVYHLWRVPWRSWCMSALGAPPDADVGSPLGVGICALAKTHHFLLLPSTGLAPNRRRRLQHQILRSGHPSPDLLIPFLSLPSTGSAPTRLCRLPAQILRPGRFAPTYHFLLLPSTGLAPNRLRRLPPQILRSGRPAPDPVFFATAWQ